MLRYRVYGFETYGSELRVQGLWFRGSGFMVLSAKDYGNRV